MSLTMQVQHLERKVRCTCGCQRLASLRMPPETPIFLSRTVRLKRWLGQSSRRMIEIQRREDNMQR